MSINLIPMYPKIKKNINLTTPAPQNKINPKITLRLCSV